MKPVVIARGFAPIATKASRVLVLGSMPGKKSLDARQYYAHPHNAFWKIMGRMFGAGPDLAYEERVAALARAGVAVWDVLESCSREGSLDASIDEASIVVNDFRAFFDAHPGIRHVFFNGAKAEHSFNRYVRTDVDVANLRFTRLPSTSPAHASIALPQKIKAWCTVAEALAR
ncbi:MAG TPA: DNA-deoxyinosine glycosylase [Burkholderiales bacterium]|nr:DNA-deoxyinosine glycosylase [Burkholderiales bacterium]